MKKTFKVTLAGRAVIDLEIDGDDELVKAFIKTALTDSFAAFHNSRESFSELIIDGVKSSIVVVKRDEKGKFIPKDKKVGGQQ